MKEIRLRFPRHDQADLALGAGIHGLARRGDAIVAEPGDGAPVQVCIDRRGVWMTLEQGAHAVHVNGRPVRRLAMLRAGDAIHLDGVLVQLLAARPSGQYRALFLDEPIASLDPKHQIGLLQAVRSMARVRGIAALVVLHDVNLAAAWCDRLLLLGGGGSIALDTPASALTTANLERAYDTPASVMPHPLRPAQPLVLFG